MWSLSTDSSESAPEGPAQERGDLLVKVLVPVAVALILIAAGLAERGPATRDLQLVAPRSAPSGQTIPLRAYFLDLAEVTPEAIEGASVSVVLRGVEDQGPTLAEAELSPSETLGYVGELTLPAGVHGTYQLFATGRAPGEGDEPFDEVRRRITIGSAAEPAPRRGRLQTDLQRYELGPATGTAAPEHLEARVVGGDCTNHMPCRLLVWVGAPAASVALRDLQGASDARCEGFVTTGWVRCDVTVRGNEANASVVAERGGAEVGRRRIQLPMGSPAPALRRARALVPVGHRPTLTVAGLDERYVVDLFHEGFWIRSATIEPADGTLELPWAFDAPGLWRVQVRRDVFGSNSAAVATWWVGDDGAGEALRALADHPRQNDWMDPAALAVRAGELDCSGGPGCGPERIAAFMLAAGELEVITYPRSSSGAEQASAGIRSVQWGRRGVAAGLIFLAGLLVAFVVHRRAKRAGQQARRILEAGRDPQDEVAPSSRDAVPAASAAFLVLIFAVVAAIVLARGCLAG
jgi:hypothetical protein